jgi:hypothetical protein
MESLWVYGKFMGLWKVYEVYGLMGLWVDGYGTVKGEDGTFKKTIHLLKLPECIQIHNPSPLRTQKVSYWHR